MIVEREFLVELTSATTSTRTPLDVRPVGTAYRSAKEDMVQGNVCIQIGSLFKAFLTQRTRLVGATPRSLEKRAQASQPIAELHITVSCACQVKSVPILPHLALVQCWTPGHFRFPGCGDSGG